MDLREILRKHHLWVMFGEEGGGVRADLSGLDLRGADLSQADLMGVNLRNANLSGANLRKAWLGTADLTEADLSRADLTEANLNYANLFMANLNEANLTRANLYLANLCEATLRGTDLSYADLGWTDLSRTVLKGANFNCANLDFSCLPLCHSSLSANFDDKQIIQFLYHTIRAGLQSNNTSDEVKNELIKLKDLANKFHRVGKPGVELLKNKDNLKEKEDEK